MLAKEEQREKEFYLSFSCQWEIEYMSGIKMSSGIRSLMRYLESFCAVFSSLSKWKLQLQSS